ncbi:MAG: hypothetical protein WB630_15420 [Candidatus Acidiferrales bacterium]
MLRLRALLLVVIFILARNATEVAAQQPHSPQSSASAAQPGSAANIDPSLYSALRWRLIGPYRAGRVSAVAGIPGDPTTYYMGTPGGGVWKTTSSGTVWTPIFDQEHVASIGDVAVAPSNPSIVIVGTGEQTDGNGVYRSTDAGVTWINIGLKDSKYISTVIIDPRNPNIILVGVLGHPILGVSKPGENRGVYKTTDGGKTWAKTLYQDDMAGVSNMAADPNDPRILYAALWTPFDFRSGPPEGRKQDSWIYKSTDEGATWKPVSDSGLPLEPHGRVGLAVAPGTKGQRVFAIMEPGLFRSDDGGATWRQITKDPRINGNLYICRVYVDPNNADLVYVMQTTTYRSTDGGQNFIAYKGAPGGDDYHVLWIDPHDSKRMILGVDQGATISVDGGRTWSSWYNQPTGQLYHVITDNQFPYISYAPQQDSGTIAVPNRSDYGEISFRDWFSVGGFEFCYIAPDPANPNIIYSGGWYGSVLRFDKITGQIVHVFVRRTNDRMSQMPPLVFSPQDSHTLYLGAQYILKTTNGGQSWMQISPDLTTPAGTATPADQPHSQIAAPAGLPAPQSAPLANGHSPLGGDEIAAELEDRDAGGKDDFEFAQRPRGSALTVLTPSPVSADVMWAGTSNGLVRATRDAAQNWLDVTPPDLPAHSEIIAIEASPYDVGTAYVVLEGRQDPHPYIFRTRDSGRTWQKIVGGLDPNWVARIVREDPVRKGMLYAGTANALYVSFDDGDHWQSLQLNFPASDVRDLAVHGNDLVAATYGRGLWILDDLLPLREAGPEILTVHAYLLKPEPAIRVRYDNDQETPLPPEEPTAKNPPDGAIIDYYLDAKPSNPLTLEIRDPQGKLVRQFTSLPPKADATPKNVPDYWFGSQPQLSTDLGINRFVWDLHYDPPEALNFSYYGGMLDYIEYTLSDHALPADTPREQTLGPIAVPGQYQLTLIGNGSVMKQPLSITLDPRVHVSQADLEAQLIASKQIVSGLAASAASFKALAALRAAIAERLKTLGPLPEEKPSAGKEPGAPDNAVAQAKAKEKTEEEKAKDAQVAKLAGARSQTSAPPLPNGANVAEANAAQAAAVSPQTKAAADALKDLDKKAEAIQEGSFEEPGVGPVNRDLARTSFFIQSGDAAPSETAKAALDESCSALNKNLSALGDLSAQAIPAANAILAKANLAALPSVPVPSHGNACEP